MTELLSEMFIMLMDVPVPGLESTAASLKGNVLGPAFQRAPH